MLTDVVTGRQFSGVDTAQIFFSEVRRWKYAKNFTHVQGEVSLGVAGTTGRRFPLQDEAELHPISVRHIVDTSPLLTIFAFRAPPQQIPASVVKELCSEGTVLHCAGGLMVEHALVQPYITKIEGSLDSVMGLSKALVLELLEQHKEHA